MVLDTKKNTKTVHELAKCKVSYRTGFHDFGFIIYLIALINRQIKYVTWQLNVISENEILNHLFNVDDIYDLIVQPAY